MKKIFTCIICPNGCEITAEAGCCGKLEMTGAKCSRGREYVRQEIQRPMRSISTSVLVENGEMPLASVRLTAPIPKERIAEAMEVIRKWKVKAPVHAGTIICRRILGYESDVIVTRTVLEKTCQKEDNKNAVPYNE